MDRPRPIDRKQTMGRHPSTARAAKALCITFIQNPVYRRAGTPQHVISSGGAVRGSADGSASATRESMPRPNHGYAPPQDSRTITVRVEVTSPLDPARLAAIPTQGAHQTVTAVTRESSESRATTELLRSASWQSGCRLARSYRGISCRQGRSCTTAEDDPDRPLGPPSALGLIEHRYRLISRRPPLGSTRQWGHLQPPQTA
jgi:hypothetical protein